MLSLYSWQRRTVPAALPLHPWFRFFRIVRSIRLWRRLADTTPVEVRLAAHRRLAESSLFVVASLVLLVVTAGSVAQPAIETMATAPEGAAMPNPASQNCAALGGRLEIEERGDGGQYGVCYFEDNRQCEEWALLRGECPAGGIKVTGYVTEAARYCAITGGTYTATGTTPDGMEAGDCTVPDGEVCYAWAYYNGYCGASSHP